MELLKTSQKLIGGLVATAALTAAIGGREASAQNFTFTSVIAPGSLTRGTSTVTFTNGGSGVIGAPTDIDLANLSEFTTTGTGPNTFTNAAFTDTVTITDAFTGKSMSGMIGNNLNGSADGGVSGNAPSAMFTDTPYTPTTLKFSFTDGTYTLTQTSFVSPGPNSGKADGSLGAAVTFTPATPEPGSVASFGVGALGLAALLFARRRKALTLA